MKLRIITIKDQRGHKAKHYIFKMQLQTKKKIAERLSAFRYP